VACLRGFEPPSSCLVALQPGEPLPAIRDLGKARGCVLQELEEFTVPCGGASFSIAGSSCKDASEGSMTIRKGRHIPPQRPPPGSESPARDLP
jgi:hypothetical protein